MENENVTFAADEELCELICKDGKYFLVDLASGEETEFGDKVTTDGYYKLPDNRANRKCFNKKNLDAIFEKGETVKLTYKASKTFGPTGTKLPNAKLISYLPEEIQAEYKAIIDRAIEARNAAKKKPLTPEEKAIAKRDKLLAQIAAIDAQIAALETAENTVE